MKKISTVPRQFRLVEHDAGLEPYIIICHEQEKLIFTAIYICNNLALVALGKKDVRRDDPLEQKAVLITACMRKAFHRKPGFITLQITAKPAAIIFASK